MIQIIPSELKRLYKVLPRLYRLRLLKVGISVFIMANCVWNVKRKAAKTVRLYKLLFSRKNSPERSADLSGL